MRQFTREEANIFYDKQAYLTMSSYRIAEFQLGQERLCMPVEIFHQAVEEVLGHKVYPHQLITDREFLLNEVKLKRAA